MTLVPVTSASNGRLEQRDVEEPGGPRVRFRVFDTVLDGPCFALTFGFRASATVCRPFGVEYSSRPQYDDAACTSPAYTYFTPTAPTYVEVDGDSCRHTPNTFHRVVAESVATIVYEGPSCSPIGAGGAVVKLGPDIGLPGMTAELVGAGPRIGARVWQAGEVTIDTGSAFDRMHGIECNVVPNADPAQATCSPLTDVSEMRFADSACTIPIEVYGRPCGGQSLPPFVRDAAGGYRTIGASVPPVYYDGGAGCVLDTLPVTYHTLGGAVSVTPAVGTFVTL